VFGERPSKAYEGGEVLVDVDVAEVDGFLDGLARSTNRLLTMLRCSSEERGNGGGDRMAAPERI
jgi:hypothetical protein